jgi:tetratricopeptide (TPR) repeat protein
MALPSSTRTTHFPSNSSLMPGFSLRWVGLGLAILPALAHALPYRPVDDSAIIETLPVRYDPALAALGQMRQQVQQQPNDLGASLKLARSYIEAARRDADPRFLGYAQSTLASWPDGAHTPVDVRVLRATILQSLHQFDAALRELDAALAQQPSDAQALLTRATVLQVRGRFPEAQRDCANLLNSAGDVTAALCLGSLASVTGRLDLASSLVQRALGSMPASDVSQHAWAYTLRAEIAAHQGHLNEAARLLQQGLAVDPNDRYARAALCDVLLDLDRPEEVLNWTADQDRDDNLLLRRALALRALALRSQDGARWQDALAAATAQLRERHLAAQQRGDRTHLREAARMQLVLIQDPVTSLKLARENWTIQREPADVRILIEAARAAHDTVTIDQVSTWVHTTGLVDSRIARLLKA